MKNVKPVLRYIQIIYHSPLFIVLCIILGNNKHIYSDPVHTTEQKQASIQNKYLKNQKNWIGLVITISALLYWHKNNKCDWSETQDWSYTLHYLLRKGTLTECWDMAVAWSILPYSVPPHILTRHPRRSAIDFGSGWNKDWLNQNGKDLTGGSTMQ